MREFMLELDYGTRVINGLKQTWIQRKTIGKGWMLCYEDEIFERGIIYRSTDKTLLLQLQDKLMDAYVKGEHKVRL